MKLEIPDDSETMMDPAAGGELDIGSFVEGKMTFCILMGSST